MKISIKYYDEKKRFLFICFIIIILLFIAGYLFKISYSSYQSKVKLNTNISKALYIFEADNMTFNLDSEQIIPSNDLYTYKFSISNFNETKHSDVDLTYTLRITTTTNLPLNYKLYRNQNYDDLTSSSILDISKVLNDVDGAWYNVLSPSDAYTFTYDKDVTDIYTLVVEFPFNYSENSEYADCIDNITIAINSKQIVE